MIEVTRNGRKVEISNRVRRIIDALFQPPLSQRLEVENGKGKVIISYGGDGLTVELTETIQSKPID